MSIMTLLLVGIFQPPIIHQPQNNQQSEGLPCLEILEKYTKNTLLYYHHRYIEEVTNPPLNMRASQNSISEKNYVFQPLEPMTAILQEGTNINHSLKKIKLDIAVYRDNLWLSDGTVTANIEANRIIIDGITLNGLIRLSSTVGTQEGASQDVEFYTIISASWKRDILTFCQKLKQEIELNPDPRLLFSTIAVSHLDHTMEMISRSTSLSDKILKALAEAVDAKQAFTNGECPDFVVGGLNRIRLKRFAGAEIAEFDLFVPADYRPEESWPLSLEVGQQRFLGLEKSRRFGRKMFYLRWYTICKTNLHWKDYRALLDILKGKLNVDTERVFIYAICENGIAGMSLMVHYPDQWAQCDIEGGNSFRHLAGNTLNLPVNYLFSMPQNPTQIAYYTFASKCFEYFGCTNFTSGLSQRLHPSEIKAKELFNNVKVESPKRVLFTTDSLQTAKAYWVQILCRVDENLVGTIDASVDGQTVFVETKNVDAYTLDLTQAPINPPAKIVENGRNVGLVTDDTFTRPTTKYKDAIFVKSEHLQGPISDAFTEQYVVVYGTSASSGEFTRANKAIAEQLSNGAPCFADSDMPEELVNSHNLILVGTPRSNTWVSKIQGQLPLKINENGIVAAGRTYNGSDVGIILIYPNPINTNKYIALFGALSEVPLRKMHEIYLELESMPPADVVVFEVSGSNGIKWHIIEKFNAVWNWHSGWSSVLSRIKKEHPKWQWQKWVAKAIRHELNADIGICGDPFRFSNSALGTEITYRDLFNSFRNDWIVKISLSGKKLRELVMAPFSGGPKRRGGQILVDGISIAKQEKDLEETSLCMRDINNDKKYTVALHEKLVNGETLGVVLTEYEIVGDCYLVPLLKDYLYEKVGSVLDAELDSFKFNFF